ncbi:hypothetical protein HGP16_01635 [Rhizobium sp. P40RR-XXII]|uniref:hypothetical protein n=1 Tax=unclassified Rhizobium TaxID=2613769 RepID=UPI0014576015|nr:MULTISPECIES: hypothetical protein [unclassified Rhizobium]NLR84099.1 hypothetical protein [Rhizobium sp. P28RR-XV]NLS15255.1 hypothetical protein [Rhizobium sp. P40RR-XXII]
MNQDTIDRLDSINQQLHARTLALSQSREDPDHALMMSALSAMIEAVRSLDENMTRLDGPKGIGSAGS